MATFQISAWWSTPLRRAVTLAAVGALVAAAGWWGLCGSSFGPLCKLGEADLLAQAEKRLQRNDFAGAQIDLRNVLRDNPQSARGRVLFAQALLGHGDAAGALQELDNARQHGAPDDATWEIQAAALLAQGRPEQVAAQFAGKRLADGGATARLQTAVARAQLALGDAAAAAAAIEAALAAVPDHVPARVLQARLMAVAGRRAEALQASDRLLAEAAQDAEAWLLRADLLAADPSPGENALTAYRKAVELGPRLAEAHGGLVNLLLRQGDANGAALAASGMRRALPGSPLATYLLALTAYLKGDLESAREQLQLLKLDSHPRLLLLAGTVESRVGNLAQAETYLLRALQSVPDDAHTRRELAALYLRRGQAERALGMLEPVLAASAAPADAQAWRLAGQAHLRMGQFDRADQAFKQVKRLQPNDRAVDLDAARLLMARGSVDAAIRALEASAQADPTGLDADMELVTTHMARGDHKAALAVAEGMTRKAPDAAVTWLLRARIQALAGDAAGARESFVAASRRDPQDLQAVRGLAELDLAAGRPDVAKGCYEEVIKANPRSAAALLALADLTRRTGGTRSQAAEYAERAAKADPQDARMRRAVIAFHRDGGDAQRALSAARAAHSALPDDADILLLLAEVQLAEGDVEQAIASLGRVAELRPGTAEPQVRLVEAFLAAKRPERAWAAAERALAMAPDWLPAARAVVGAAIATQRIPHARAVAQQWQQRQPRTPTGWLLEADIELSQARWDAGISALRKALEKGADAHAAWLLYRALNQSGRTAEARQHAEDWLRRHPRDTMFLNLLGDAALHRGDLAEAEARFAQALSIQPESPTLMNNLAFALVLQKKPEAKALALKAVQAAPYSAPVLDTLAHAFAAEGNAAKAVEIQTQVVELMPRATTYRVHLARFHLQAGDRKKAEEELDRLLAQLDGAPLPADVKALQQQLRG